MNLKSIDIFENSIYDLEFRLGILEKHVCRRKFFKKSNEELIKISGANQDSNYCIQKLQYINNSNYKKSIQTCNQLPLDHQGSPTDLLKSLRQNSHSYDHRSSLLNRKIAGYTKIAGYSKTSGYIWNNRSLYLEELGLDPGFDFPTRGYHPIWRDKQMALHTRGNAIGTHRRRGETY